MLLFLFSRLTSFGITLGSRSGWWGWKSGDIDSCDIRSHDLQDKQSPVGGRGGWERKRASEDPSGKRGGPPVQDDWTMKIVVQMDLIQTVGILSRLILLWNLLTLAL